MTIKSKILYFLKELGIPREEFYKTADLSPSNFKGVALKSELGGDKIVKILTTYRQISPDWLLLGEGPMLRQELKSNGSQFISGSNNIQTGGNSKPNIQLSQGESIKMLHSQINEKERLLQEKDLRIKEKDAQIKEKDAQISKLLSILSK